MNETTTSPVLVIGITLLVVILFNFVLITWARNRKVGSQYDLFKKFMDAAKNPWQQNQSELNELSELLKQQHKENPDNEIRNQDVNSSNN